MNPLGPDDPRLELLGKVGYDASLAGLGLRSLEEGRAELTLEVGEAVQNMVGTLHGGAIATLVDVAGTLAILSADAEGRPGVTTDLNVSYFRAARAGERVQAKARVLKLGRTLAFVSVAVEREDGALLAEGRMTKFLGA
ncbi:MAG: PaaI family thioesterase [Planctomycetota bacterium]|nr:MAG: PaaI family thioesterase [Planctomycetota bacterium]